MDADRNDKRRAQRRESKGLHWDIQPMWLAVETRSDGRSLVLNFTWVPPEQNFAVVSIETVAEPSEFEDILGDHTHKEVGSFATMEEAKSAATAFAVEWLRGATTSDPCDSEPIAN